MNKVQDDETKKENEGNPTLSILLAPTMTPLSIGEDQSSTSTTRQASQRQQQRRPTCVSWPFSIPSQMDYLFKKRPSVSMTFVLREMMMMVLSIDCTWIFLFRDQ